MNEYSQMVADLAKPGEDIIKTLTPITAHMLHMAVGLSGEVGELKEHELLVPGYDLDSTILEELGDIEFYFEGLCQSMSISMEATESAEEGLLSTDRLVINVAEMLDMVKKMVMYNKEVELMVFVNQLIVVRSILNQVYAKYGHTVAEAKKHNMTKLVKGDKARYKEGSYSDEAAQSRRDKEE